MSTRRTIVELLYNDTDITRDVAQDLIAFEYTDNDGGGADDIAVKLKNDHGLWSGDWLPGKGDSLKATIDDKGYKKLYCGSYEIDEIELSGAPDIVSIKAVSVPLSNDIRRENKSKTYENVELSTIAGEVAERGQLALLYDASADPLLARVAQNEESDLAFLTRVAKYEGYTVKVTDKSLVIFDPSKQEQTDPVVVIEKGKDNILNYNFSSQAFDLYQSVTVSYYNIDNEQTLTYTATAPDVEKGMKLTMVEVADSLGQAERWASAELKKRNRRAITGSLTLVGEPDLFAGAVVECVGFGHYSGRYLIKTGRHSVGRGYTTNIELERVLEDY